MRISDWSSDVSSSDLFDLVEHPVEAVVLVQHLAARAGIPGQPILVVVAEDRQILHQLAHAAQFRVRHMPIRTRARDHDRSADRTVGKECVSTCKSRMSTYH